MWNTLTSAGCQSSSLALPKGDSERLVSSIKSFVRNRAGGGNHPGEFAMCGSGHTTLYASAFAAMTLDYLGALDAMALSEKQAWIEHFQGWQEPATGLFVGPELAVDEMTVASVDWEYHASHLTIHVLPALHALGAFPTYPLLFAHRYLNLGYLKAWFERCDWRDAWKVGNSLLFVGQLLVYLRDVEHNAEADKALEFYFDWLDARQEPDTGVWGTRNGSPLSYAVYGAYHQFLVYFYCNRPIHYRERVIDSVLSLQHPDGGFEPRGGGGACQDVDCADILVKMSQQTDYRVEDSREALRRLLGSVLDKMTAEGGFVYRRDESFIHHGLLRTYTPPNVAELFSTWFRTHTLALIAQLVDDEPQIQFPWRFNRVCSMGWHNATLVPCCSSSVPATVSLPSLTDRTPPSESPEYTFLERMRSFVIGRPVRKALSHLSPRWMNRVVIAFVKRYLSSHTDEDALRFLLGLDEAMFPWLERQASMYTANLLPPAWPIRCHHEFFVAHLLPGERVLHLGCETGGLTYTLAVLADVEIVGFDGNPELIAVARNRYHHRYLDYRVGDPLFDTSEFQCDVMIVDESAEKTPGSPVYLKQLWDKFSPSRILMRSPRQSLTWQAVLRQQLAATATILSPTSDVWSERFLEQLTASGFRVVSSQIRWGQTWIELREAAA